MRMHTIFIELLLDLITCAKEQNRPTTESAKGQTKATTLTITAGTAKTNKLATQNILDKTNQIDNQKGVPENLPLHDTVQPRKISD